MSPDDVRALASSLDGAAERDHHGRPPYRDPAVPAELLEDAWRLHS